MSVGFGFLVAASVASYAVQQLHRNMHQSPASINKPSEIGEASFEQKNQLKDKQESAYSDDNFKETNQIYEAEMEDNARKQERLHIKEFQDGEVKPEDKLLEYSGLKEQESDIVELQRLLKIKTIEIEMLNITLNSLQSQTKKLREEIELVSNVRKELEVALDKIKELERQTGVKSNKQSRKLIPFPSCFKRSKVACSKDCSL